LPEGIALLAAQGEFDAPGSGDPGGDGDVDENAGGGDQDDGSEAPRAMGGDGNVCSVRPGAQGSTAALFVLALFGLVTLRRRRR
jgi:hypothetical protein